MLGEDSQAFENISKLTNSLSDILCRLATGGGWRTRTLFQNTDETLFEGARPIALEGIANFVSRGDFQDRAIILPLEPMSRYRTEQELNADFERQRAGIFGGRLAPLLRSIGLNVTHEQRTAARRGIVITRQRRE